MKKLVTLKYKEAKDIVRRQDHVYWKSGVWNKYELRTDINQVLEDIDKASFGVDVFEKDGNIYVSRPSDGDMY